MVNTQSITNKTYPPKYEDRIPVPSHGPGIPFLRGGSVKTRERVLRAGFGSASADKFLSESVRILAERLTQSELVPRLR